MSHDFDDFHGGYGGKCDGKGIMSYGSFDYDQWSSCSKKDWQRHYKSRRWWRSCLENTSGQPGLYFLDPINM